MSQNVIHNTGKSIEQLKVFASTKPNAIYQRQGMIFIVHNFMVFIHIIKGAITDFIPIVRACNFALISAG